MIALDCVNAYVQGKALVLASARVASADLADGSRPLKEILAAPAG